MTRNGIVVEVDGDRVRVALSGAAECGSCAAKASCYGLSGRRDREISCWVRNDLGATRGDRVELELTPATSLKVIVVTFLLPVILLGAGYLLAPGSGDPSRAAGAGAGLAAGIFLAVLINRRLARLGRSDMHIVSVAGPCDPDR